MKNYFVRRKSNEERKKKMGKLIKRKKRKKKVFFVFFFNKRWFFIAEILWSTGEWKISENDKVTLPKPLTPLQKKGGGRKEEKREGEEYRECSQNVEQHCYMSNSWESHWCWQQTGMKDKDYKNKQKKLWNKRGSWIEGGKRVKRENVRDVGKGSECGRLSKKKKQNKKKMKLN